MPSDMEDVPMEGYDVGIVPSSNPAQAVGAVEQDVRHNPSPGNPSAEEVDRPVSPVRVPIRGAEAFLQQLGPTRLADLPVNESGEATSCAICYEPFEESQLLDNPPVKTDCNHVFCKNCLAIWLDPEQGKLTCPICRRQLFEADGADVFPAVVEDVEPLFIRAPQLLRALTRADARLPANLSLARNYPHFWRVILTALRSFDGRHTNVSGIAYALFMVMDMFDYVQERRLNRVVVQPPAVQYDCWSSHVLLPVLQRHRAPNVLTQADARRSEQLNPLAMEIEPGIHMFSGRRVVRRLRTLMDPNRPRTPAEYMPGRPNLPRLTLQTQESVFLMIYGFAVRHSDQNHCAAAWTMIFEQLAERHLALVRQADRWAARGGQDAAADDDAEEDRLRLCDMDYLNWLRSFMTFVVFSGIENIVSVRNDMA